MGVSKNRGTPKSSILIGFPIIFTIHFGGCSPYFWFNTHIGYGKCFFDMDLKFPALAPKKTLPFWCPPNHRVTVSPISSFTLTRAVGHNGPAPQILSCGGFCGYFCRYEYVYYTYCTIPDAIHYILYWFQQSPHDESPIYIYIYAETCPIMRNSREFPHWDHDCPPKASADGK